VALVERFFVAVTRGMCGGTVGPELLPMVLSQAAVAVLPVEGAGVSLVKDLRVPIGASDELAARAEALQTTLGEGPCLTAAAREEPLVADLAAMAAEWPVFHHEFIAQTPYRSVASVPLRAEAGPPVGALDLYSTGAETLDVAFVEELIVGVADPIEAMLFLGAPVGDEADLVTAAGWWRQDRVADRMLVWVAVGMLMERSRLSNPDALAVLRGYAFTHQMTLDVVAAKLASEDLTTDDLVNY
jgi:hypothetical protein